MRGSSDIVALLVATALVVHVPRASAQHSARDWAPADRTVIGDFSRVTTVAASSDRVYITSPTALVIWNPNFQRWEGPFDPPDPAYLARARMALADPLDNSLWVARQDGWTHYQPDIRLWDSGVVPGGVRDLVFDLDDPIGGPRLLTPSGWISVARGGGPAIPSGPPRRPFRATTVEDALQANPTLRANSAAILLDPHLRNARYTSASRAFDRRGWYIGTWGVGVLYLPDGGALPQRLAFGLQGDHIGALFAAPGGVWVLTERTTVSDAALTFVASDLTDFRTVTGTATLGLQFDQARVLVGQGTALWAATDAGAARIDPVTGRVQLFDQGRGLPDTRTYAVSTRRGQITVATARGVARITDSMQIVRVAPDFADAAYAVAVTGDTTWIGTAGGVFASLPGQSGLSRPRSIGASASMQTPVLAFRFMSDTLVALTQDQLLWRNPNGGVWTLGPALSPLLGRLRVFALDGDGFWVAGERGLAYARLDSPPIRPLINGENPTPIRDLAVDAEHLWVATDQGLVRWRLDVIRP